MSATDTRSQVRAWITYDWANSAFATTILAAVLPVYYSSVAGATLPSAATATQYYSVTLSASVLVVAILSPVLGAVADATGTRKRLLLLFAVIGIIGTAGLFGVNTGDWILASVLFVIGRIGFGGANVFYDALLPHITSREELDRVSARGYAFGYLGGGLLLTINAGMILALPEDNLGFRLSLLSVAVWWAVFSVPLIRHVPEPPGEGDRTGREALRAGVSDAIATLRDLKRFPDLRRFLVSFLIYNDAIGAVIAVAAIYGVELGFAPIELTFAILLVQFLGMPYALVFGSLPTGSDPRRKRMITAFVVANIVLLPLTSIALRITGPSDLIGSAGPTFADQGIVAPPPPDEQNRTVVEWRGQSLEVTFTAQPGMGEIPLTLDGEPLLSGGDRVVIDAEGPVVREGETITVAVPSIGDHVLVVPAGAVGPLQIEQIEVLPATRTASLPAIIGIALAVQLLAGLFALTVGRVVVARFADRMTTKSAINLALIAYLVIGLWGAFLDSVVEFWLLAWLVAVVQGGSQALSRSLYARLVPDRRSGEFFGFFSILSKFASFVSPFVFTISVALFASSRPAVGSLSIFFALGMWLLRRVDVDAGRALADAEDDALASDRATATD
ncbi:MFS transporter [Euzebya tangerina]|uniref:MFS transporter n=1 Tax=Euzebya tangerina TaxID=591198 RepID=UPI0013C2B44A|nr:MFS transporter [Euzebya tangerina]